MPPPFRVFGPKTCQLGIALLLLCLGGADVWSGVLVRVSHVVAQDTPKGLAMDRFKALVEQRSGGQIQVRIYPEASLYGDYDEMEALRLGAVDILAPSLSKFGRIGFPEFELFDLPFLFNTIDEVRRITQGPVGQELLGRLGRQELIGLGYLDNGFKHMSASRPLRSPADFVGLRMRVQSSRVISGQFRALGARPVSLAFSETRLALAKGVVDGTENPISNFWTQGMHLHQSDLSLTNHGYLGYAVVANQHFWRHLALPDRNLIEQSMREALAFGNRIADIQNDKALTSLRETHTTRIHALTSEERTRLRQAVQPVYDELGQRIGMDWIVKVQSALSN